MSGYTRAFRLGDWVGPIHGLEALEKKGIGTCSKTETDLPVFQPPSLLAVVRVASAVYK